MLSSMISPLCNEFLAGAKSLTETVDSRLLGNLMGEYWGFALINTTSLTNGLYSLAWTWQCKRTGPGVDNQVGKEWPLGVHCWYEKSLSCSVAGLEEIFRLYCFPLRSLKISWG